MPTALTRAEARAPGSTGKSVRFGILAIFLAAGAVFSPIAAPAQGVSIVRDAEIEALLQDYARPIFKAASIKTTAIEILLVPDPRFNAFVADSKSIFVNTGTILTSETPNELIGVLAHETAHLAHQDLPQLRQRIADTKIAAIIASVVGMGAAVAAGAATKNGELVNAGAGLAQGIDSIATRSLLSYSRGVESAADRSAITYLDATGQSPIGMMRAFQRMARESLISARNADPYLQNHPLPTDRIAAIEDLVRKSKFVDRKDPPDLQLRHDLARAKLAGFTEGADRVARRYPASDASLPARYARAIATYRRGAVDDAVRLVNELIAAEPNNPFFYELKGQALLEHGRAHESLEPYRKAVDLLPGSGLLRIALGQALVNAGDKALVDEAIKQLTVGLQSAPNQGIGYRMLARAYDMKGNVGMAQLATAQGLFADGAIGDAKVQAKRAQGKLAEGSPAWLRADDILSYKPVKN
ncbi:MAG: M48 family metalloprotease [Bauldia sp.]